MAKNLLNTFTHRGVFYSQHIDTEKDSVEITTIADGVSYLIITFDSSCNVLAENGMRLGHISGFCDDNFIFTLEGRTEPAFYTHRNKRDPEFIFKFEEYVFYFLAELALCYNKKMNESTEAVLGVNLTEPQFVKENTEGVTESQVKLHGCIIGSEIEPGREQKTWLKSDYIHSAPKAIFTGAPQFKPGVQLHHINGKILTWIPASNQEACGVQRVGNKWHWLIRSDTVGTVEGIRQFCLGNGEVGCDGCGQEKNWVALNKLPDEKRLAIQANAQRIDDVACIMLKRPWRTTLLEPVVSEVLAD